MDIDCRNEKAVVVVERKQEPHAETFGVIYLESPLKIDADPEPVGGGILIPMTVC